MYVQDGHRLIVVLWKNNVQRKLDAKEHASHKHFDHIASGESWSGEALKMVRAA